MTAPRSRRFAQCDVFSTDPTLGNGLAVVVDAEGMSDVQMQRFAAWTNLAETTFLLPPSDPAADYSLRIFTPGREMKFAGHPTLGSCAAWLNAGGVPKTPGKVIQHCAIGLVEIDLTGEVPAFVAPPTSATPMPAGEQTRLASALGLSEDDVVGAAILDNGPVWALLETRDAKTALAIDAARVQWPAFQGLAVVGAYPEGHAFAYEARNLAPSSGMLEDPITGSLCAAIAQWLAMNHRLGQPMIISQGTQLGRTGRVHVRRDETNPTRILVGGHTNILITGTLDL